MNKVTTINLNGNAYQLEEDAYEALRKYLDQARKRLADDPDRDEILSDLESAIAEKCDHYLHGHKSVVVKSEVKRIIEDMGPVEAPDEDTNDQDDKHMPPKRLYLLRDGAMIGGVCTGFAAYFNLDVTIVRLIFVLLVFLTSGFWILIYLLLMVIVPEARTPEERAEARGERFSAHDVIEKAKQRYADISDNERWHHVAEQTKPALSNAGEVVLKATRILAALVALAIGIGIVFLTLGTITLLWSLHFGHIHFDDQLQTISRVAVVAAILCLYYLLLLPAILVEQLLQAYALRRVLTKQHVWGAIGSVVLWIAALTTLVTIGLVNGPRVRDYEQTHGYMQVYDSKICINDSLCGNHNPGWPTQPYPVSEPVIQFQ